MKDFNCKVPVIFLPFQIMAKTGSYPLDFLLSQVEKPGQYAGGELNTIVKNDKDVDLRTCLIYPDTYEVGMPFLGFQILYHLINRENGFQAERAYAPRSDMELLLQKYNKTLFSLETRRALNNFDVLGFTLPYEMNYTNILNILALGKIPLMSRERAENDPIVIAGGACAYNPEPLKDFIDLFLIGDGEESIIPLLRRIQLLKSEKKSRPEILNALSVPEAGYYVPAVYDNSKDMPVRAQKVNELTKGHYPLKPYIPVIDISQDRFSLEVQRGCTEGCRFCQAGMITRPVRERTVDDLMAQTRSNLENSGYEEMSLMSLSTGDYSDLDRLLTELSPFAENKHVSVSFPSLRLDGMSPAIVDMAASQRKSGFTFAPEAGSQRLRKVINKNISDEDLYSTVELALKKGWKTLKFYYMLGLPTETEEDLQALIDQIRHILQISRPYGRININVTLSSFIPKPFTPFQWARQCNVDELQQKIDFIKNAIRHKQIKLKSRDPYSSLIEGILARGGAECAPLIHKAWASGAKFDAWKDTFNINIWREALNDVQIRPEEILGEKPVRRELPWEFIDTGLNRSYLQKEYSKALLEETTYDCRDGCTACGVCDFRSLKMDIAGPSKTGQPTVSPSFENAPPDTMRFYYRLKFKKFGNMRYVGHHDLFRIIRRAANITGLPVAYSSGFNSRPKISLGYPVPMTYEAFGEYLDIEMLEARNDLPATLNSVIPPGMEITESRELEKGSASVMAATRAFEYRADFKAGNDSVARALQQLPALLDKKSLPVLRRHPRKGDRTIDIRPFISSAEQLDDHSLTVKMLVIDSRSARLSEIMQPLFGSMASPAFLGSRTRIFL